MRLLAWLVGIPVALLVILFAVSNRGPVTIGLWPFTEGMAAPSFVVALIPFALGLILGAGWAGIGTVRARWRHRGAVRQVDRMHKEMEEMRARHRRQIEEASQGHGPALAPPRDGAHPAAIDTKAHP